ncbi:MAG TPA: hypothetical protein PKG60_01790 [Spirochaetota bacterium]|nr:hypothetical protein [Spirochaetota bacterium]HPS86712.1 hypothetical protein [Spirochaetota bacterium]
MIELLDLIKSSYLKRTTDIPEQKEIWIKLSDQFRPDLTLYRIGRPSTLITRETGDLGLSVLWIVQAALIRPILKEIVLRSEDEKDLSTMLGTINHNSLCALAHSENPAEPVILSESGNGFILNGEKKFITAGRNAELMMVTCRMAGDEKISHIALIDPAQLPDGSRPDLKLDIMKSVSHTKLILNNTAVQHFQIPRIDPSMIRRLVKKFGILERALILEAFISFLLYAEKILNDAGAGISAYDEISSLMEMQSSSVTKQIDEAVYSEKIETQNIPLQKMLPVIDTFKKAYIKAENLIPEQEKTRLRDLFLFDNLKG